MEQQLAGLGNLGAAGLRTGRLEVQINIGRQADGCTYALHPRSAAEITKRYPGVHPAPSIYVGYATRTDFESLHGPMWPQIAALLTGLGLQTMDRELAVTIFDPRADKVIARLPHDQAQ
jgi:hypothetical protein